MSIQQKKKLIIIGIVVAGIAVLVGLGPIIVARVMRRTADRRRMEQTRLIRAPLILEVRGKVSLREDGIIMLTSDSDMRYILLAGEKLDALKEKDGETITVFGKIKRPQPKEIDGNPIRYNITVTTWTDKPIDRKKALKMLPKEDSAKITVSGILDIIKEGIDLGLSPLGRVIVYDVDGMVFLDVVAYSLVEQFIGKEVEVTGTIKRKGFRYRGGELKTIFVATVGDIKLK